MNLTHVVGDIFESGEQYIAHGCNTKGFMGAGVARIVAERYPEVFKHYKLACDYAEFRVGTVQGVHVTGTSNTIINLGTQENPGADATLWAILLSFGNLFELARQHGIERVAIPRIGCGIGGLKWSDVERTIVRIYEFVPDGPEIVVYTHPSDQYKVWK